MAVFFVLEKVETIEDKRGRAYEVYGFFNA